MTQATAAQVAEMDRVQGHVEGLLAKAEKKAFDIEGKSSWFRTDLEEASLVSIKSARRRFNTWVDGQDGPRRWAIDGRTPDGRPYSPEAWADFGRELGGNMAAEVGFLDRASYYALASEVPGSLADGAAAVVWTAAEIR